MVRLPSRERVSVFDRPVSPFSRRASLPANFFPCTSPSREASVSGEEPAFELTRPQTGDEVHLHQPVGRQQIPRPTSLPASLNGLLASNPTTPPVAFRTYRVWSGWRRRLCRRRLIQTSAQGQADEQDQQQAQSTSGRDSLFSTNDRKDIWEESDEEAEEDAEKEINGKAEEQVKDDEVINNLIAASRRRFPFQEPPRGEGPTVFTLAERMAMAQPDPGFRRLALPYTARPRAPTDRRRASKRPSSSWPLLNPSPSAGSSSYDADDEASSNTSVDNSDEDHPDAPFNNSKNNENNHPHNNPDPTPIPKPRTTSITTPALALADHLDHHPTDRHTATLNNPRLHTGELANRLRSGSGSGSGLGTVAAGDTPPPVFRTISRRLSEAEPRRRKISNADGARMAALYLRRVEGGELMLSEGESSPGSGSGAVGDGGDEGEGVSGNGVIGNGVSGKGEGDKGEGNGVIAVCDDGKGSSGLLEEEMGGLVLHQNGNGLYHRVGKEGWKKGRNGEVERERER